MHKIEATLVSSDGKGGVGMNFYKNLKLKVSDTSRS